MVDFERALLIKPSEWRALRELGNLHLLVGELPAAVAAYDRALEYEDRDADLHANAALAHSELGDVTRALRHLQAAVAANPRHAGAHNTWAAELVKLGRIEEALSHARLASEIGDDPDFDENLAKIESLRTTGRVGVSRAAVGTAH